MPKTKDGKPPLPYRWGNRRTKNECRIDRILMEMKQRGASEDALKLMEKELRKDLSNPINPSLANSYCMARINGRLCHARIPVTERYCESCKQLKENQK